MWSPYLYRIIAWLTDAGLRVHEHCEIEGVAGRYEHKTKEVFLCVLDTRQALLTLAHEAGHWLGYRIAPKPYSYQRERQAYVYGWHVLRWFDVPITRSEWLMECREAAYARMERLMDEQDEGLDSLETLLEGVN